MRDARTTLLAQLASHWPAKLWLGTLLTVLFSAGYFAIQRFPLRAAIQLSPSAIDRLVPFSPDWVIVYQSMYLMLPLGWLARTRADLARYTAGLAIIALVGFGTFLAWPVAGPRPAIFPSSGPYGVLAHYDAPTNSFPSLHIALAVYSACVGMALVQAPRRRALLLLLPAWILLIAYSTLATKQHYAIDLPPGAILGWAAHRIAWFKFPRTIRHDAAAPALGAEGSPA